MIVKRIVLYIWQLPQHVFAIVLLFIFHKKMVSVSKYKCGVVNYLDVGWGVSLGKYILLRQNAAEKTVKHEYGHSIQSMYFGPLYLIIIGLPSIVMNLLSRVNILNEEKYYERWPESWADSLGGVQRNNCNQGVNKLK
jgi:hypothetical protein